MPISARFVDLSEARTLGAVVAPVAGVLGVGRRNLRAALDDGDVLLVLDNAEQVSEPLSAWLDPWPSADSGRASVQTPASTPPTRTFGPSSTASTTSRSPSNWPQHARTSCRRQ